MLRVYLANQHETREFEHREGPLEFGRGPERGVARCVVNDPFVSKDQMRITRVRAGLLRVENLSARNPLRLGDDTLVNPSETTETKLPTKITIGKTLVDVAEPSDERDSGGSLRTIDQPLRQTIGAGHSWQSLQSLLTHGRSPSPEVLAQWFETVVSVTRSAATNVEFLQQTAKAVVELVGLDTGIVLMRNGDKWKVVGEYSKDPRREVTFSERILKHVVDERRTFFQAIGTDMLTKSLVEVEAVVASPVFAEAAGEVTGAIYGTRYHRLGGSTVEIRPLEAQVVQVLAAAVGAGLARLEQTAEASRRLIQLEQTLTPELARELDRNPKLLEGQDREITVMFGDIRNFSRLSEKLGPADTCQLVREVLERLTHCIRKHQGVVLDYLGDGILAMWNAPMDQPDHAVLACRAALAMIAEMPLVSAKWQPIVGSPLKLGVGLNTGHAMVGNTGNEYKTKYGPLGHTVNLASRVEGATKQLEVPILITGSTRDQLGDEFITRRLCQVRVVGIAGKVDLCEVSAASGGEAGWADRCKSYETALEQFENRHFAEACRMLYPLLSHKGGFDIPSLNLLTRSVQAMKESPEDFDSVLELRQK